LYHIYRNIFGVLPEGYLFRNSPSTSNHLLHTPITFSCTTCTINYKIRYTVKKNVIVPLQMHRNWLRKPSVLRERKTVKKITSRYDELWWHSNALDDENVPADVTAAAATATGPRTMDRGNVRETTVTFVRGHLATDGGGGTYRKTI